MAKIYFIYLLNFYIMAFILNKIYLALYCCIGPLQKQQQCIAQLTGTIYGLKEGTPFL